MKEMNKGFARKSHMLTLNVLISEVKSSKEDCQPTADTWPQLQSKYVDGCFTGIHLVLEHFGMQKSVEIIGEMFFFNNQIHRVIMHKMTEQSERSKSCGKIEIHRKLSHLIGIIYLHLAVKYRP